MQFIIVNVFICAVLMSIVETATFFRMSKPKLLNLDRINLQETIKLPEDRRKLSIFPKTNKKFVIHLKSVHINDEIRTQPTKKPLMKKMKFQNSVIELKTDIQNITESKLTTDKPSYENILKELKNLESLKEKETKEIENEASEESPVKYISDDINIQTEMYPENEGSLTNTDVNKNEIVELESIKLNKEDDEIADLTEFIFLNPIKHNSNGAIDVTTVKPMKRIKRNDNVIEEENLGTTVSGNKFKWQDTRLTNDVPYKNIHS